MAASQAVLKRRFDWDDCTMDMSHRSCPPLSVPSPLVKRPRLDVHSLSVSNESPSSSRQSPFVIKQFPIESLIDRPKKRVRPRRCQSCGNPEGLPPQEQLYNFSEVQCMIENAVRVASEKIKAEYDVVLHQQLCDQFNTFTRFNQDFISRQFKKNEISYLS